MIIKNIHHSEVDVHQSLTPDENYDMFDLVYMIKHTMYGE